MKNRSLPFGDFKEMLSGMMGGQSVDIGNLRSSMSSLFGDDSSARSMDYSKYISMAKKVCDVPGAACHSEQHVRRGCTVCKLHPLHHFGNEELAQAVSQFNKQLKHLSSPVPAPSLAHALAHGMVIR
eukprot:scaffold320104_cov28-Tisochrysis_lutea.AAC.1